VLCGNGERVEYYRAQADDCTNILFPGWVNFPKIWVLLRRSAVGLAPYINIDNFSLNLPNKPPEYFSAALPVITGLHGVLSDLLEQTGTGVVYEAGNPTDLAQNLCALFDDPVRRRRMSDNARELYLRRFQADDIYGALANHLELVIDHYKQYQSGKKLPF
jgi:glycosyltransferase involved in cell wall biosynthesis